MAWNPSLSLNPEFVRTLRTTLPRRRALFVAGLIVALLLAPCALAAAWLGGVGFEKVARLYLFLLVGGFAWQALGLYASAAQCGASERAPRGGLLVGPLIAVGGAVSAL